VAVLARFKTADSTSIYGMLDTNTGMLTEEFATNPHCVGVSELKRGTVHDVVDEEFTILPRREFNAAYLMQMPEELEETDATASLAELRQRYPIEA
jgi:hypothetical protein